MPDGVLKLYEPLLWGRDLWTSANPRVSHPSGERHACSTLPRLIGYLPPRTRCPYDAYPFRIDPPPVTDALPS